MKILIHSNVPWAGTGYGQQTAQLATRLRAAGHDVAISAVWGLRGGCLYWEDFLVYPEDEQFGNRTLRAYAQHHGDGDLRDVLVIPIMDVWVLKPESLVDVILAPWTPVDHSPIPPAVLQRLQWPDVTPIAMSRFGEDEMEAAGLEPLYAPHAIDTKVFRPLPDRDAIRAEMGVPDGAFVVGMVARNTGTHPPRKAFPQVLAAFAAFRQNHPNAFLYLHTDIYGLDKGMNLYEHLAPLGVPQDAVAFPSQLHLQMGAVTQDDLARIYNGFDVLVNPSYGEGFGVPIVEAQACGTPVIVTEWTSMPELCGAGWRVGGEPYYNVGQGSYYMAPSPALIFGALEEAYEQAAGMRDRARAFALDYDADLVFDRYWLPIIEQLAPRLGATREVPALV